MNVLITGGGGFIGRNLKKFLPPLGYKVFAPTHKELDMSHSTSVFRCIHGMDTQVVIHTATAGGTGKITYDNFKENMVMFENIKDAVHNTHIVVINIGSGAEFNRGEVINKAEEMDLWKSWPVDLYGLSKNIVSRRTIEELKAGCVFRLFGCFGEDEQDQRFIKRSILRLKEGKKIQLHGNGQIDFFYIEDVAKVVDHFLKNGGDDNMNLVYPEKIELKDIATMIHETMEIDREIEYTDSSSSCLPTYTGNGSVLEKTNLDLLGLKEGIKRMVKALT